MHPEQREQESHLEPVKVFHLRRSDDEQERPSPASDTADEEFPPDDAA